MTSFFRALSLTGVAVLVAASACRKPQGSADAGDTTPTVTVAAVDTSLIMSLERGPCRGTCPVYRVDIHGDGRVSFDGQRHVASLGMQEGTAPVEEVQNLLRSIASGEFSTVDTLYAMESAGCGSYVADLPASKLSAKIGAAMKTVHHDPGCRNAPQFLRTLEAQIDSVARTAQWITGKGDAAK